MSTGIMQSRAVKVIAHRGASGYEPENTLLSFQRAIELGADQIELDVRLSRDGRLVVIHDGELSRTTNGRGLVKRFDLTELRKLDAGKGQTIPVLEEVVGLARYRDVILQIELKALDDDSEETGLVQSVLDLLIREGMEDRAVLSSFSAAMLKEAKSRRENIVTGLLVSAPPENPVDCLKSIGGDRLHVHGTRITPELVEILHSHGIEIVAWGRVNEEKQIDAMIGLGVDGITSDYPDRVIHRLRLLTGREQ